MAQANIARREGDDFQARLFWLHAARLLDPKSAVLRVSYERGPKAFDDIQVDYDPAHAPKDSRGLPILRRHHQSKWHTSGGAFGFTDLADPDFVNATKVSFLQRAHQAQAQRAPDGSGCQFKLVTNWRIKPDDPLIELVRQADGSLNLERLFEGKTEKSKMGQVRKLWCEHLGLDEAGLDLLARTMAIAQSPESLDSLRERLDDRFAAVGMKRVPASESSFFYDDLIFKLLPQGRVEFDRDRFRQMAMSEALLEGPQKPDHKPIFGIRSFLHAIDDLEDRCDQMLDLVPHFDGRYIRDENDWQGKVHPQLRDFTIRAAQSAEHFGLILDTHASLAFAAGSILNVKSGKNIEIEQRTRGRRFWSETDAAHDPAWPKLVFQLEKLDRHASDLVVAVTLTHDVSPAVCAFVSQHLPQAGRILHCRPESGPSQHSVACGRHAWLLAESLVQQLQTNRAEQPFSRVHIFIAGPNGFVFFLGQHQQAIGPCSLYEWDFDGNRGGGYRQSLTIGGSIK